VPDRERAEPFPRGVPCSALQRPVRSGYALAAQ